MGLRKYKQRFERNLGKITWGWQDAKKKNLNVFLLLFCFHSNCVFLLWVPIYIRYKLDWKETDLLSGRKLTRKFYFRKKNKIKHLRFDLIWSTSFLFAPSYTGILIEIGRVVSVTVTVFKDIQGGTISNQYLHVGPGYSETFFFARPFWRVRSGKKDRMWAQTLTECLWCRGEQEPSEGREELSGLRLTDPLKYARLAARLVTPGGGGGPCPPPAFPGRLQKRS
jgi:hypothetical protein